MKTQHIVALLGFGVGVLLLASGVYCAVSRVSGPFDPLNLNPAGLSERVSASQLHAQLAAVGNSCRLPGLSPQVVLLASPDDKRAIERSQAALRPIGYAAGSNFVAGPLGNPSAQSSAGISDVQVRPRQSNGQYGDDQSPVRVPDYVLTLAARESYGVPNDTEPSALFLRGHSYILAAIDLSYEISWARIAYSESERSTYVQMQIFQWLLVIVSATTTVIIALKGSIGGDAVKDPVPPSRETSPPAAGVDIARDVSGVAPRRSPLNISAIVLSTLGTALATMNSYYAPRVAHDQMDRSLKALRVLHHELVDGINREAQICDALIWPPDWRSKKLKSVAAQLAAIDNAGHAASAGVADDGPSQPPPPPQIEHGQPLVTPARE